MRSPRPDYRPHVFEGNLWLVFQNKARPDLSPPLVTSNIGDLNQMNSGVYCVPAFLDDAGLESANDRKLRHYPNLLGIAQSYLERINANVVDLVHYAVAVLHDPAYNQTNADALRAEGPRIPLPNWPDGAANGAAKEFARTAAHGRTLTALLDSDTPVPSVTSAILRSVIAAVAMPATVDGRNMATADFAITAGWGHYGHGDVVMPGQGRAVERAFTADERAAMSDALPALGETTFDIYLNANAFWRNVPAAVWRVVGQFEFADP